MIRPLVGTLTLGIVLHTGCGSPPPESVWVPGPGFPAMLHIRVGDGTNEPFVVGR